MLIRPERKTPQRSAALPAREAGKGTMRSMVEGASTAAMKCPIGARQGGMDEAGLRSASSALWSRPGAGGARDRSRRRVQGHGGADERLQRRLIDRVALMEIDGAPGVAFEAGVEQA